MKTYFFALLSVFAVSLLASDSGPAKGGFDAELAQRLGADERGLYIFNVATVEEAEKLVVLDPAVEAGVFVPELTPWYGSAALMVVSEVHEKIEKPKE